MKKETIKNVLIVIAIFASITVGVHYCSRQHARPLPEYVDLLKSTLHEQWIDSISEFYPEQYDSVMQSCRREIIDKCCDVLDNTNSSYIKGMNMYYVVDDANTQKGEPKTFMTVAYNERYDEYQTILISKYFEPVNAEGAIMYTGEELDALVLLGKDVDNRIVGSLDLSSETCYFYVGKESEEFFKKAKQNRNFEIKYNGASTSTRREIAIAHIDNILPMFDVYHALVVLHRFGVKNWNPYMKREIYY